MMPHAHGKLAGRERGAGLILLEAILSLALFILSALLVGAAVNASLRDSTKLERQTRGLMLAESLLAQIRAGQLVATENLSDQFVQFPDYSYRLSVAPVEQFQSLQAITVTVTWQIDGAEQSVSLTGWEYRPAEPAPDDQDEPLDETQPPGGGEVIQP